MGGAGSRTLDARTVPDFLGKRYQSHQGRVTTVLRRWSTAGFEAREAP